jgi:hypothetical protein
MNRNLCAFGGIAIATAILLTACGGSSSKGSLGDLAGGGASTNLPAAASSALAELSKAAANATGNAGGDASSALGGPLASVDVTKLCAAVSQGDIQKLFKDGTTPKLQANPGECDWGDVSVDVDLKDTTKQFYPGGAFPAAKRNWPGSVTRRCGRSRSKA